LIPTWYVRDQWAGTLHKLGVEVIPMRGSSGPDSSTVYMQHGERQEADHLRGHRNTLVVAQGHDGVSDR
jgi:hypothetical protein